MLLNRCANPSSLTVAQSILSSTLEIASLMMFLGFDIAEFAGFEWSDTHCCHSSVPSNWGIVSGHSSLLPSCFVGVRGGDHAPKTSAISVSTFGSIGSSGSSGVNVDFGMAASFNRFQWLPDALSLL